MAKCAEPAVLPLIIYKIDKSDVSSLTEVTIDDKEKV